LRLTVVGDFTKVLQTPSGSESWNQALTAPSGFTAAGFVFSGSLQRRVGRDIRSYAQ
jgi:hypothetical protein